MAFESGHPFYGNPFRGPAGGFPAGRGGLIHVNMDVTSLRRMTQDIIGQFDRGQSAIYDAMRDISLKLMQDQQAVLKERISQTGRVQARGDMLMRALVDDKNRKITADGFTVGYLDQAWAKVALYYRGLELGTSVHETAVSGLTLRGYWVTPGGIEGPRAGGTNAIGFSGRYVEAGGFAIKRPIPAYHYMEEGMRRWFADSNNGQEFLEKFAKNFDDRGLNWLSRFTGVTGREPSVADVHVDIEGVGF